MDTNVKPSDIIDSLATPSGETYRFSDPVEFASTVAFSERPETPILETDAGATTPNVLNATRLLLAATSATLLTNFLDGAEGQELVVFGDGNTTVQHGTNIFTNTGANKLLVSNRVYVFYHRNGKWYEH